MSGKNKTAGSSLADELAALRQDTPTVLAAVSKPAGRTTPAPQMVKAAVVPAGGYELREKTTVTMTPAAASALRRLQAFLMVDCDAGTVPAAVAVNLALELAAGGLPGNRDQLLKLLSENRQADKRKQRKTRL